MLAKTARQYIEPHKPYAGLTPNEVDKAKAFLRAILRGDTMAKDAGVRLDTGKCINAYRGNRRRGTL